MFLKPVHQAGPSVRLAVSLPADVAEQLESYSHFYEATYKHRIDRSALVIEMLRQVMQRDAQFRRFLSGRAGSETPRERSTRVAD